MTVASDPNIVTKVQHVSNGDAIVLKSGGTMLAESGSTVDLSGATLTLPASLTLPAALDLDSTTGTFSSNAVTITKRAAVLTSESLSTAHTASQALVVTLSGVASGDLAMVSLVGGTNTGGIPLLKAVCTTNTVTITISNMAKATDAFNGTFIINMIVFKA